MLTIDSGNNIGLYGASGAVTALGQPYSNANVALFLPTYSGNLGAGNLNADGNVIGNQVIANAYLWGNGVPVFDTLYSNANAQRYLPNYVGYTGAVLTTATQLGILAVGPQIDLTLDSNMNANFSWIGNLQDPLLPQDAATKAYVDSQTGNGGSNYVAGNGIAFSGANLDIINANVDNVNVLVVSDQITLKTNPTFANVTAANFFGVANSAIVANSANAVAGANVTGTVASATVAASANSVAGANVTGQVANALVAGTVYTAAQPNITSVGALTGLTVNGDTVMTGNFVVTGNTTYIDVTNFNVSDPIIGLGRGANNTPLIVNDGKDRGEQLWYFNSTEKSAFIGYDASTGKLLAATEVSISGEVVTVNTLGNIVLGNIESNTLVATGNVTAANFNGDGSNISNVAYISNGTSNVKFSAANGNILGAANGVQLVNFGVNATNGNTYVAIGANAGFGSNSDRAVYIGANAGSNNITGGGPAIVIGHNSGQNATANNIIAIGSQAGNAQSTNTIAIGIQASNIGPQGQGSIAIGTGAGSNAQGANSIAFGRGAAALAQGVGSIAIGQRSGSQTQGGNTIAIGYQAGYFNQGANSIAIGTNAAANFIVGQGIEAVAIGNGAAVTSQGSGAVAIGQGAGSATQGINSVAIGYLAAGNSTPVVGQGANSVALGYNAGFTDQGANSFAFGAQAGRDNQGANAVALGSGAGFNNQGEGSIVIGYVSGNNIGTNSIAIGKFAGANAQIAGSIVISATGTGITAANAGTYIAPIRTTDAASANAVNILGYNTTSKEITWGAPKFPVYTGAAARLITGSVGQQICISDSAGGGNPNGMMAFWDTTNTRWSYIHDNTAV